VNFFHIAITFNIHNLSLCIVAALGETFITFMNFSSFYLQNSNAHRNTYMEISVFFLLSYQFPSDSFSSFLYQ